MAKAKRNVKTHPNPNADGDEAGDETSPERTDLRGGEAAREETIDVFAKEETVNVDNDGVVDNDSAREGDGRSMAREDGDDANAGVDRAGDAGRGARRAGGTGRSNAGADDGEDRSYSQAVRKRIARERAAVNRERALREQAQRELGEERTARQATDERVARLERQQTEITGNTDVKALEAKIAALIPQIAAATEAGNTAEALRLQIALGDAQGDLKVLKYDLKKQQEARDFEAAQQRNAKANQGSTDVAPVLGKEESAEFIQANKHWWNRPKNLAAQEATIKGDKALLREVQDGDHDFEPYSPEYFEELSARVHEAFPDIEMCDLDGEPYEFSDEDEGNNVTDQNRRNGGNGRQQQNQRQQGNGRGGRAPMGQGGQGTRRQPNELDLARQGKVNLTEDDFATMRTFKMDPKNPEHKKAFAKERMRSILTGNGRGNQS